MTTTLKLVLTDHWFEEIKSGRKTHEYRKATDFWANRINKIRYMVWERVNELPTLEPVLVQFQKAYRKNPERMIFEVKNIYLIDGENTDLHHNGLVYDIELGERLK